MQKTLIRIFAVVALGAVVILAYCFLPFAKESVPVAGEILQPVEVPPEVVT
jgi:hypothetical protein